MRYVSPAWLFNGHLPDHPDSKTLRLRRTQLLADLELSGATTIEYHGEVLTKNDIILLFDELEKENTLAWHQAVAKDRTLLAFLEDIHFDDWAVQQHCVRYLENPLYEDTAFIKWLSPNYYDSFMFYMEINCLKASNGHALVALLSVPLLMTPADEEKAWQATSQLIEKPIARILRYAAKASSEAELARTSAWMEEGFLQLVHLLPEQHFGPVRDKYALAIFEACSNVHRKSQKYLHLTPLWMENAIRLAVSPAVKNQLEQSRKKMFSPGGRIQKLRDIPLRIWIMILAVLILCYWLGHK